MGLFASLFGSRRPVTPGLLWEVHGHLLPGVDDGVADLGQAMACLDGLVAQGYQGAILTPHANPEVYGHDESALLAAFDELAPQVAARHPTFGLRLAAEYILGDWLWQAVRRRPHTLLTWGGDARRLLVELLPSADADEAGRLLHDMRLAGLSPILAHVERYRFLDEPDGLDTLAQWREQGVLTQVNLGSPVGQYGPGAQRRARRVVKRKLVDLWGGDLHRPRDLPWLQRGWQWLHRHRVTLSAPAQAIADTWPEPTS